MGPGALSKVLCSLPGSDDPDLLVGFDSSDDASVYRIDENTALIQTVDVFPPIVDDPYMYGQIAAANSLSDVYAMGGRPKLALNIFCFPEELPEEALRAILLGGHEKITEAGAIITGGHTIMDREPKYGFSVTGFAHPDRIITNRGMQTGDALILTKAIGTGILTTADRAGLLDEESREAMISSMARLNRYSAEIMAKYHVNACTDVTGFGLLVHAFEMARAGGRGIRIDCAKVPLLPRTLEMAERGMTTGGGSGNREYLGCRASVSDRVTPAAAEALFDPQTSGGLLISLPEDEADELLGELKDAGEAAEIIGCCDGSRAGIIEVV